MQAIGKALLSKKKMRCFLAALLLLFVACKDKHSKTVTTDKPVVTDTVPKVPIDSVDMYETDCYDSFFASGEKLKDTAAITVSPAGYPTMKLKKYITDVLMEGYVNICFKDMDNDGKKEMVIFNYTGGMHCCDEFYVYEETAPGKYVQKVKLFAGTTCVNTNNEFTFSVYELLGYFYTCYACLYVDSAKGLIDPLPVVYKYQKGKLVLAGDTAAINQSALKNLELLKQVKMNPLKEDWDDSGVRKMYALNFATWHLTHGNNYTITKALFDQYYTAKDKNKVWKELKESLEVMEEENTFIEK